MSAKVECIAEVRNITILKETLREQKIKFNENDNVVSISRNYNNMIFDFNDNKKNNVSYDSDDKEFVHSVMRNYQKNVVLDKAAKEGHTIESCEETENGEIIIRAFFH